MLNSGQMRALRGPPTWPGGSSQAARVSVTEGRAEGAPEKQCSNKAEQHHRRQHKGRPAGSIACICSLATAIAHHHDARPLYEAVLKRSALGLRAPMRQNKCKGPASMICSSWQRLRRSALESKRLLTKQTMPQHMHQLQ